MARALPFDMENFPQTDPREIAFIDRSIDGHRILADGIRPGVEIVVLTDGLAQIADWAARHAGYDVIHILSHGEPAALRLGDDRITTDNLDRPEIQAAFAAIGGALRPDGDLALYACDLGRGKAGKAFVAELSALAAVAVTASEDRTGAAALDGNWSLTVTTRAAAPAFPIAVTAAGQQCFPAVLAELTSSPPSSPSTLTISDANGRTIQVGSLSDFVTAAAASNAISATAQVDVSATGSASSLTLPANLQTLTLTGSGDATVKGNSLNNYLVANQGQDILVGGTGRDMLLAGSGLALAPIQSAMLADGAPQATVQAAAADDAVPDRAAVQAAFGTVSMMTGDASGAIYRHGFDRAYYLVANPDVAASGMDPVLHYQLYGSTERRAINALIDTSTSAIANDLKVDTGLDRTALFDAQAYVTAYPDVASSGLDPLTHFKLIGAGQGRSPYGFSSLPPLFDAAWYLGHNPDVAASGMNAWTHYSAFGWREGRNPGPGFDQNAYLAANPDVKAAGINPLLQYELVGAAEGRTSKIVTEGDAFAFGDAAGHWAITDFRNTDGDLLTIKSNVNASGIVNKAGLVAASTQVGNDVLINLGPNNDVRLLNFTLADLSNARVSFL